jgi:hypothetical protein
MNFNQISTRKTCTTNNESDKKLFYNRIWQYNIAQRFPRQIVFAKGLLVFQQNI